MTSLALILAALVPLSATAQSEDLTEAATVAISYALDQTSTARGGPIVIDTIRTASNARPGRSLRVADIVAALGAKTGVIEDYCFRVPASGETELKRMEVRGARAVVAAEVLESETAAAVLRVTVWRGEGSHTGGIYTLKLERNGGRWAVIEPLTQATTGCIPGA